MELNKLSNEMLTEMVRLYGEVNSTDSPKTKLEHRRYITLNSLFRQVKAMGVSDSWLGNWQYLGDRITGEVISRIRTGEVGLMYVKVIY